VVVGHLGIEEEFPGERGEFGGVDPEAQSQSLALVPHAAYLWCPDGILESRAAEALLGKTGRAATSRNWATVGRIAALLGCR
jgi:uncharacterized protein (DUF1697 family)